MTELRNQKKRVGFVVSNKMQKTISVLVERRMLHAEFKKYIRRGKKYLAHDEKAECGLGDKVEIVECRPISKRKSWRLSKVLEKAKEASV